MSDGKMQLKEEGSASHGSRVTWQGLYEEGLTCEVRGDGRVIDAWHVHWPVAGRVSMDYQVTTVSSMDIFEDCYTCFPHLGIRLKVHPLDVCVLHGAAIFYHMHKWKGKGRFVIVPFTDHHLFPMIRVKRLKHPMRGVVRNFWGISLVCSQAFRLQCGCFCDVGPNWLIARWTSLWIPSEMVFSASHNSNCMPNWKVRAAQ